MKLRSLLFGMLLCVSSAISAADVITRTDGTTIDAKVEEITETTIRYRLAANPTGPIYSIPRNSVTKVIYENGYTDNFDTSAETTPQSIQAPSEQSPISDAELVRYAQSIDYTNSSSDSSSDGKLINYLEQDKSFQLYSKAKKYRLIGWIGGGVFVLGGTIAAIIAANNIKTFHWCEPGGVNERVIHKNDHQWIVAASSGVACGAIWTSAFLIRANQLSKQAEALEMNSSSIIEEEILRFGDKSLTAGISIMGNHMTNTQGYGLSFKLNF